MNWIINKNCLYKYDLKYLSMKFNETKKIYRNFLLKKLNIYKTYFKQLIVSHISWPMQYTII